MPSSLKKPRSIATTSPADVMLKDEASFIVSAASAAREPGDATLSAPQATSAATLSKPLRIGLLLSSELRRLLFFDRLPPWNGCPLDELEQKGKAKSQRARDDNPGHHPLGLEYLRRAPDEIADAKLGRDELRRHHHDQRDTQTEPKPGKDRRQGSRQNDLQQNLQFAGAAIHRSSHEDGVDRADSRKRADGNLVKARDGDDSDFR